MRSIETLPTTGDGAPKPRANTESGVMTESSTSAPASAPWLAAVLGARNRIVGLCGLVSGIAVTVHGAAIGFGDLKSPGPGLWPAIVGAALTVVSVLALVPRAETLPEEAFTPASLKVLPAAVSLALFVVAFELVGLVIPGFLLLLGWMRGLGRRPWLGSVIIAAATVVVLQYLFVGLLSVPLPDDLIFGGR